MHKSFKTFILIAIVLVTCALAIYPPKKNLRLGRDLAGGVNLVYSVNLNQGDNADEVIGRMIEVLKERVNPEGLYEISFVQQGRDEDVFRAEESLGIDISRPERGSDEEDEMRRQRI